jgi:hypothetical protein
MSDNTPTQTGYAKALALIEQAAVEGWKVLDLAGLGLKKLPNEIGKLLGLEELVLGKWDEEKDEDLGNALTTLPAKIRREHVIRSPKNNQP